MWNSSCLSLIEKILGGGYPDTRNEDFVSFCWNSNLTVMTRKWLDRHLRNIFKEMCAITRKKARQHSNRRRKALFSKSYTASYLCWLVIPPRRVWWQTAQSKLNAAGQGTESHPTHDAARLLFQAFGSVKQMPLPSMLSCVKLRSGLVKSKVVERTTFGEIKRWHQFRSSEGSKQGQLCSVASYLRVGF